MPPSEFWGTDTWTVMDAYEGYAASKGINRGDGWTSEEKDELKRMVEMDKHRKAGRV